MPQRLPDEILLVLATKYVDLVRAGDRSPARTLALAEADKKGGLTLATIEKRLVEARRRDLLVGGVRGSPARLTFRAEAMLVERRR